MMDKFPKAQVDVYAYVLENDGGALAAAITAASLALTDASIEMYDMVAACNVRLFGKVITDNPLSVNWVLGTAGPAQRFEYQL